MEVTKSVWKWITVDESWWKWIKLDTIGGNWMVMEKSGGKWIQINNKLKVDCSGLICLKVKACE